MKPRIGLTTSTSRGGDGNGTVRFGVPEPYVRRVEEAGGLPVALPTSAPESARAYLGMVDGIVLIGGADVDPSLYDAPRHPRLEEVDLDRDRFEIALVQAAAGAGVPTLGVCRGIQVMNVALGGTLHQDIPSALPGAVPHRVLSYEHAHPVRLAEGSLLHGIVGTASVDVNSSHHQAIDGCAKSLRVVATAPDGVVEAAEAPGHPFLLGVQWHPERLPSDPATRRLFSALVAAAGRARRQTAARA